MQYPEIVRELEAGRAVTLRPHGNSMTPIIRSGQRIVLEPVVAANIQKGDVVLAKVNGRYYIHKVTAIDGGRWQISNNHGHVNGWSRQVFGIVTEVGD